MTDISKPGVNITMPVIPFKVPEKNAEDIIPAETKQETITRDSLTVNIPKKNNIPSSVFNGVPAAASLDESKKYLNQRKEAIIAQYKDKPVPDWVGKVKDGTAGTIAFEANAKLTLGADTERVNKVLQSAKPYSNVGTDAGFIRSGDYDFTLTTLTATLYNHLDNPALDSKTKKHIATTLLNQEGNKHMGKSWLLGIIPETENHILMTESSRYLKNQLVQKFGLSYSTDSLKPEKYNNKLNGFNDWFVEHLSEYARNDFDEYNSRPYQAYTVRAVQNMYDFAGDPEVKKSAQIVLDYVSARFATQSSDLRRVVPFRRRENYKDNDNLFEKDSQSSRFAILAGNYNGFQNNTANKNAFVQGHMLSPAMSSYKVPDAILDIMVDKGNNPYFMKARHENTEIVYAEENFTISAGGHHHDWSKLPFSSQENGQVMPTVVMLKDGGPALSNMIRFLGRGDSGKMNNTGVYENFASGIRPVFPEEMAVELKKSGKLIEKGNWKFAEIGNVYVAMYTHNQKSPDNYADSVGFVEVVDKKEFASLAGFKSRVEDLNKNNKFQHYGNNTYNSTRGKTIDFVMAEPLEKGFFGGMNPPDNDPEHWAIKKVLDNGKPVKIDTKFDNWPLSDSYTMKPENDGENNDYVIKADGTGQIIINNPKLNKSLLMSLADHHNPIRIEQDGEAVNLTETAQVSRKSIKNGFDITVNFSDTENLRYMSLKWDKGSKPEHVHLYALEKGGSNWKLLEKNDTVFTAKEHDFRTDFEIENLENIQSIKFLVTGKKLNLEGSPEIYRNYL